MVCVHLITAGAEDNVDLIVGGKKSLRLARGFEPSLYFFAFSGRPVRPLDPVIQAFMRSMICLWRKRFDRFDIAAQLVGYDHSWLTKWFDQPRQKPLGRFRIALFLNQNIKNIPVSIYGPPEPKLLTIDWDHNFVQMSFIVGCRTIAFDTISEMASKTVYPFPHALATYDDAPL